MGLFPNGQFPDEGSGWGRVRYNFACHHSCNKLYIFSSSHLRAFYSQCSPPIVDAYSTTRMPKNKSLNKSNMDCLINVEEGDIKNRIQQHDVLRRLRNLRVQKFNTVAKCLGMLLNMKFLNLAIYGHSIVRIITNHYGHLHILNHKLFLEGLDHVPEIINMYKMDSKASHCLHAQNKIEMLDVLDKLELSDSNLPTKASVRADRDGAIKLLSDTIAKGIKSLDIINDTKELHLLLYKSDDYFDRHDGTLEVAIDNFLQKMDKVLDTQNVMGDTHLLPAWLENFHAAN